jgi:hypothetical protein
LQFVQPLAKPNKIYQVKSQSFWLVIGSTKVITTKNVTVTSKTLFSATILLAQAQLLAQRSIM